MSKKVARMGVFIALAMIFSYIEVLIPFNFGIPGVKLGIANIVTVTSLYVFSTGEAFGISVIRIVLMGILFGNGMSLLYSLAGGLLSFLAMWIGKRTSWFSVMGVSVAGGVFHNVGQILAVMLVMKNTMFVAYLPVLFVAGVVTGYLIGLLANKIIELLPHIVAK